MIIIPEKTLNDAIKKYPDSKKGLMAWNTVTKQSKWNNPNEVKSSFSKVSLLSNNRIVFNIKGNDYRLVALFNFIAQICQIRWIGTHSDYDKINANEI